jgi:hypothetical protein
LPSWRAASPNSLIIEVRGAVLVVLGVGLAEPASVRARSALAGLVDDMLATPRVPIGCVPIIQRGARGRRRERDLDAVPSPELRVG